VELDDATGGAGLTVVCSVVVVLVALSGPPQPAVKAMMAVSPVASKSCGADTVLVMINPLIRKTFGENYLRAGGSNDRSLSWSTGLSW
jgi:hypothetical protein